MNDREKLKVMLDIPGSDTSKDELLDLLIGQARGFLLSYCRLDFADETASALILSMAAEDYGRCGGEGLSYRSVSGATEYYRGEYSPRIMAGLRRLRRIGGIGC